jgi:hypothetical protein
MHRSELERSTTCSDCGAEIPTGSDRGFDFGESGTLCSRCAIRRGGSYDAERERWERDPRVADLLEKPR